MTDGFGTFFYPIPLTIDRLDPDLVPSEHSRIIKKMIQLDGINKGIKIAITDDAFLSVFGHKIEEALRLLNTIFAIVTLRLNITCFAAKKEDLCECFSKGNRLYVKTIFGDNLRNYIQFKRSPMKESYEWKIYPRREVTLSTVENMINFANRFYGDIEIHRDLLLLSEGFTLYYQHDLNASYLYGWMMIETFLSKIWGKRIQELNRKREDKDSLSNHDRWTSYHIIEMFSALRLISDDTRDIFHNLRRKRNKIVHDRQDATIGDTQRCLTTAWKILRNREINPDKPFEKL
jgi:hypothetical protein